MEIQNLQEYINNYEITNYINASIFILNILNHFTNNNKVINNMYYIDSELILTTHGKTFYIINYNDKEDIMDSIKDLILNSKVLMQILHGYKFQNLRNYKPQFDIEYILSITNHIDMDIFTREHDIVNIKTNNYQLDINKLITDFKYLNINTEEEKLPAAILVEEKLLSAAIVEETEYENIEENDGNNLNTIDDITEYINNLKYPESMLNEIKENIKLLKKLFYIKGKLHKKENKKYIITSEHKRSIEGYINNIKTNTRLLTPHNNLQDKELLKKLNMTNEEIGICDNIHYSITPEYKNGLNN